MGEDAVPEEFVETDKWGGWVMQRLPDGWCVALDRDTMLCTIYDVRPGVCRDYVMGDSECLGERVRHGIDARRS